MSEYQWTDEDLEEMRQAGLLNEALAWKEQNETKEVRNSLSLQEPVSKAGRNAISYFLIGAAIGSVILALVEIALGG